MRSREGLPYIAQLWTGLLLVSLIALPCAAKTHRAKHAAARRTATESCSTAKFAPLTKAEMRKHIKAVAPLDPPTTGKSLHLDGSVTLHVAFGANGRVDCVKVVRGEKQAADAIAKSVKDWRFSPYKSGGRLKPAAGELAIKYHLRDQGSTAAVE